MAASRSPVPLLDLKPLHEGLRAEIDAAIREVLDANAFVFGDALEQFEQEVAAWLGVRHAIGVASGTDALLLALKAADVGEGDEVITSAFTFFGTAEAILHAHATPVFADIDPVSMNLDPADVERRIGARTRAILPVHLFGRAADMSALMPLAVARGIPVIEDAAQAFGATWQGRCAGSFGLAGCFSFHATKPLGALGDGGLVATDDDAFARRIRRLRNHGATARHVHAEAGYNSRLDNLQAAVLRVKLRHFDAHLAEREHLAARYRAGLDGLPVALPTAPAGSRHSHAQFTVRTPRRDALKAALDAVGIGNAIHYPMPLYRQPALAQRFDAAFRLPATEDACAQCLSLPLYEGLKPAQQACVMSVIVDVLSPRETRTGMS